MFAFHSFAMCWNKLVKLQGKIHRLSHLPDKRAIKAQAKWLHIFLQWLTMNTEATITDLLSVKGGTSFPACLGYLITRETAHHKLTGKHPGMFTPCDEARCGYPWANCKQVFCSAEPHGLCTPGPEGTHSGLRCTAVQLRIPASRDEVPQLSKLRNLRAKIQIYWKFTVWKSVLGLVLQTVKRLQLLLIPLQTDGSTPLLGTRRMHYTWTFALLIWSPRKFLSFPSWIFPIKLMNSSF